MDAKKQTKQKAYATLVQKIGVTKWSISAVPGKWATFSLLTEMCPQRLPGHISGCGESQVGIPEAQDAQPCAGIPRAHDWTPQALRAPAWGSWRAWADSGCLRSPIIKKIVVCHRKADKLFYLLSGPHLWNDKGYGHLFTFTLCPCKGVSTLGLFKELWFPWTIHWPNKFKVTIFITDDIVEYFLLHFTMQ